MYRVDNPPVSETTRRVRAARAYAGLSVQDLADQIGLGLQTIKRIESGKRTARKFELWAIAEACGLPREFFDVDLDLLTNRASVLEHTLTRVDERLIRIEARVEGLST
ncbi:MAG: Helix-turn-helix domain [Thermoleophilaceae bacterium]|nr:Helix-turn-helix domain [Thermoleophilaceae bacterium]